MEITRQFIRICVIIFGILVLSSYVYGLSKADDKMALWGGIPHSWLKFIVPCMFIAAIGWLIYWLFKRAGVIGSGPEEAILDAEIA